MAVSFLNITNTAHFEVIAANVGDLLDVVVIELIELDTVAYGIPIGLRPRSKMTSDSNSTKTRNRNASVVAPFHEPSYFRAV